MNSLTLAHINTLSRQGKNKQVGQIIGHINKQVKARTSALVVEQIDEETFEVKRVLPAHFGCDKTTVVFEGHETIKVVIEQLVSEYHQFENILNGTAILPEA